MRASPTVAILLTTALVAPPPGAAVAPAKPAADFPTVRLKPGAAVDVVYDWSRERCETWDVPDAPLRAVRDNRGEVLAMASDSRDRAFVGPDLDHVRHRCARVYVGRNSPDPAAFSGLAYITALWTADGKTIFGLVHDEFHAEMYGKCAYLASMKCWYNTVIATVSHDGGAHFALLDPPVLVAAPPFRQEVEQGRHRGFFNPSNIVQKDAYYYTFIGTTGGLGQPSGTCLFRTGNPADPTSWRGYDGAAYTWRAQNPYAAAAGAYRPCAPVTGLAGSVSAVVRYAGHDDFLAVSDVGPGPGHPAGGAMGAWSHDLLHWSSPFLLKPGPSLSGHDCANSAHYAYSSILDPASPAPRNFDVVGSAPYLYQTRLNLARCQEGPDRDLIRLPLVIE